ncbi:hypothetical protein G6514_003819 [Epicoccum nigrum]|nr:hypothetical protein G6514_003819 [Epicoccum nigrum]
MNIPFSPFISQECIPGNPGAVYTCSGPNFSGNCNYRMPNDVCFTLTEKLQSIGPDMGGYYVIFDDSKCEGNLIQWGGTTVSNASVTSYYDQYNQFEKHTQDSKTPLAAIMYPLTILFPIDLTAAATFEPCKYGNPGVVYVCTGPKFTGTCNYYTPTKPNDCFTMKETVKCIGPDKGAYCVLFSSNNCQGGFIDIGPAPQ